ncbi:hypothetical protein AOLI_G00170940 [Acnodon oligacanthus]
MHIVETPYWLALTMRVAHDSMFCVGGWSSIKVKPVANDDLPLQAQAFLCSMMRYDEADQSKAAYCFSMETLR